MHQPRQGVAVVPADRDDVAAIANSDEFFLEGAVVFVTADDLVKATLDALLHLADLSAQVAQAFAGRIQDSAVDIKAALEGGAQVGADFQGGGQSAQVREILTFAVLDKSGCLCYSVKETADDEQILAGQDSAFRGGLAQDAA